MRFDTIRPRSFDPLYIVAYYIIRFDTIHPRSLNPLYIVAYYMKLVKTSRTYSFKSWIGQKNKTNKTLKQFYAWRKPNFDISYYSSQQRESEWKRVRRKRSENEKEWEGNRVRIKKDEKERVWEFFLVICVTLVRYLKTC